ncbi:MAG: Cof-type HAD-IIB family hydrolase [Buchnera aphidicola (Nurudea shiraii)]
MYYDIISIDLDGTLLSPDSHVSEYTKNVIRILSSKGVYFVIATGRHHVEANIIKNILNIPAFLITSNGARVYDQSGSLIYSCDINEDIVLNLVRSFFFEKDILIQLYSHENWYVNNVCHSNVNFYSFLGFQYKLFDCISPIYQNISKIFFTSKNIEKLLFLKKKILSRFNGSINISFSSLYCVEVMSSKVSKGNALKIILNLLKSSSKKCLSFGNSMNDKEMLEFSEKGCIMKNSDYFLKKSLSQFEVIGNNIEDGVAKYLKKTFKINLKN